jgi:hypothetical protein
LAALTSLCQPFAFGDPAIAASFSNAAPDQHLEAGFYFVQITTGTTGKQI